MESTYQATSSSLQQDDAPFAVVAPLLVEAETLLENLPPDTAIDQLASRVEHFMGEGFLSVLEKLENQGFNRRDLVAALLEKALADDSARKAFSFPSRRELRRYFKNKSTAHRALVATDELLNIAAA